MVLVHFYGCFTKKIRFQFVMEKNTFGEIEKTNF